MTTLKAGMVFSDWPSSDGHNMLMYPWLSSARDQFVEHGHRLSGMTIGLISLSLAIATLRRDRRPLVRWVATAIFASVFAQGMLGGARVLLDQQVLALLHGDFAALVFSLMAILTLVTSAGWQERSRLSSNDSRIAWIASVLLLATLAVQYVLGGFLRHLRERSEFAWAWMVHPWFSLAVLFVAIVFALNVRESRSIHLRRCGQATIALVVAQLLVGLATWYVKYGVPSWGVVAQQDSTPQIVICSLHKVVGMLTLMASVLSVFCCWSVRPLRENHRQSSMSVGTSVAGAIT